MTSAANVGPPPALIGLAHGSRDPRSAATVRALLSAVAGRCPEVPVRAAFLELSAPGLPVVIEDLAAAGCRRAVVVPLLFADAYHLGVDVPAQLAAASAGAGITVTLADPLGTGPDLVTLLDSASRDAGVEPERPVVLAAVGSSRAQANAEVGALAGRWAARRPGPVASGFITCAPTIGQAIALTGSPDGAAIVPLLLAPGLLWDRALTDPAVAGLPVVQPLGVRAAGLVVERYRRALAVI